AGFFDYAIADEVHELKGDTAQGNALGTLASCARHVAVLTGTLLGGYADELFNILFRLGPSRMLEEGFEYGEAGIRAFTESYGLLEEITVIEPADNACSEARITKRVRHRPGASPLLFGRFLMSLGEQLVFALKVFVKASMCQAGVAHHRCNCCAVKTFGAYVP